MATARVMYGEDAGSQFASMSVAKKFNADHRKKQAKMREVKGGVPAVCAWSNVLESAMLDHVKRTAVPGRVYSLPLEAFDRTAGAAAELWPLEAKMRKEGALPLDPRTILRHVEHAPQILGLQIYDDDAGMESLVAASPRIVFSIVEANPSKARVIPLPPGAAARLGPCDILVALHADCELGHTEDSVCVCVAPSRIKENPICILSRLGSNAEDLTREFVEWRVQDKLLYSLRGMTFELKMANLITKILKS